MEQVLENPKQSAEWPVTRVETQDDLAALMPGDVIIHNKRKVMVHWSSPDKRELTVIYPREEEVAIWGKHSAQFVGLNGYSLRYDSIAPQPDGSITGKSSNEYYNTFNSDENRVKLMERGLI